MMPAPGLSEDEDLLHRKGDRAFEEKFVSAPSVINPGLGPTYNNTSCNGCHLRNGRGVPVAGHPSLRSHLLARVSTLDGEPVPGLGSQVQDFAILGAEVEAQVDVTWVEISGAYPDGTQYSLRKPEVRIQKDGVEVRDIVISLRQPPPVFGLGLLEALSEEEIRRNEDPDDRDGDGISGRINRVEDLATGQLALGRFGWKANQPNLVQQSAEAYRNDMGVGAPGFPDELGNVEISEETLLAAAFYAESLAVPARRDYPEEGFELFREAQCTACHLPSMTTGDSDREFLAFQEFAPFTDMLLHDMGEDLADFRSDGLADGYEWRTAPLWGIGLTQTVVPDTAFLHDGRARTIEEAILWHGGEAETSREHFKTMDAKDRELLLQFVSAL